MFELWRDTPLCLFIDLFSVDAENLLVVILSLYFEFTLSEILVTFWESGGCEHDSLALELVLGTIVS